MDDIQMSPVTSSNIMAIGYRESDQTLRVTFKSGGTYDYPGIPAEVEKNLMAAESVGKFYHANIKGKYEGVKVEPVTEKSEKVHVTVNLFYIGEDFYHNSGTMMSSIYVCNTFQRYDWGFVRIALDKGHEVNIRPATQVEMEWATNKLKEQRAATA